FRHVSFCNCCFISMLFFFFSSRRRHTRLQGDWSSDVCSSDLHGRLQAAVHAAVEDARDAGTQLVGPGRYLRRPRRLQGDRTEGRSEERRVGKECRSRWSPYHEKKKKYKNR